VEGGEEEKRRKASIFKKNRRRAVGEAGEDRGRVEGWVTKNLKARERHQLKKKKKKGE